MIIFTPWRRFFARYNRSNVRSFIRDAADSAEKRFKDGVRKGPKSGIKHASLPNRSSRPSEYPANQSGRLLGSIRSRISANEAEVGSNAYYSKWLRDGSRHMERRKMSDNALMESLPSVRKRMKVFAEWLRR